MSISFERRGMYISYNKDNPETIWKIVYIGGIIFFIVELIKSMQMFGRVENIVYFCNWHYKCSKKIVPVEGRGLEPKCFHNGIILIVNCKKLVLQRYDFFMKLTNYFVFFFIFPWIIIENMHITPKQNYEKNLRTWSWYNQYWMGFG